MQLKCALSLARRESKERTTTALLPRNTPVANRQRRPHIHTPAGTPAACAPNQPTLLPPAMHAHPSTPTHDTSPSCCLCRPVKDTCARTQRAYATHVAPRQQPPAAAAAPAPYRLHFRYQGTSGSGIGLGLGYLELGPLPLPLPLGSGSPSPSTTFKPGALSCSPLPRNNQQILAAVLVPPPPRNSELVLAAVLVSPPPRNSELVLAAVLVPQHCEVLREAVLVLGVQVGRHVHHQLAQAGRQR